MRCLGDGRIGRYSKGTDGQSGRNKEEAEELHGGSVGGLENLSANGRLVLSFIQPMVNCVFVDGRMDEPMGNSDHNFTTLSSSDIPPASTKKDPLQAFCRTRRLTNQILTKLRR
jgi:hypothetical protein